MKHSQLTVIQIIMNMHAQGDTSDTNQQYELRVVINLGSELRKH